MISFILKGLLVSVFLWIVGTLALMYLVGFSTEALIGFGVLVVVLVGQKLVFRRGS